ncbi:hypothetical protein A3843_07450 [Pseudovibrio exalbescens]|uniref:Uncharacterized protein n=1 Tax=Pseudovibrio exalbescens TaxID=197461 RepID=A0A1U7JHT0_9HYPH|nr:hypothetical protein A3843_07450 [Pseudovibrio exalbescens]
MKFVGVCFNRNASAFQCYAFSFCQFLPQPLVSVAPGERKEKTRVVRAMTDQPGQGARSALGGVASGRQPLSASGEWPISQMVGDFKGAG